MATKQFESPPQIRAEPIEPPTGSARLDLQSSRADGTGMFRWGIFTSIVLAFWLTRGAWGPQQQAGLDVSGHLVRSEFGLSELLFHGKLDGWFPRFMVGHQAHLFYGPGTVWILALFKLLSFGRLSTAGAMNAATIASFVAIGPAIAFLARSLGLSRRESGLAAVLALGVNSMFGPGLAGTYDIGLVPHQLAAPLFAVALGATMRVARTDHPGWMVLSALSSAVVLLTHPITFVCLAICAFLALCCLPVDSPGSMGRRQKILLPLPIFVALIAYLAPPALVPVLMLSAVACLWVVARSGDRWRSAPQRLAQAGLFAAGLSAFWIIPRIVHADLAGASATWGIPAMSERVRELLEGRVMFAFPLGFIVLGALVFGLARVATGRPYPLFLFVVPIGFLIIAHSAALSPESSIGQLLGNRGLGYAGFFTIMALGVALATLSRQVRFGGPLALGLAVVLVAGLPASPRNVARQEQDISAAEREAAAELTRLVREPARYAVEPDVQPFRWLAFASGRNELNVFGGDSSLASDAGYVPHKIGKIPPLELAGMLLRHGTSHVVTVTRQAQEQLLSSGAFTAEWSRDDLTILSVNPSEDQPPPETLLTAPGTILRASLVSGEPGNLVLDVDSPTAADATVALGWSPKWHYLADGNARPLAPTEDNLLALKLPEGPSRISLTFRPDGWDRLGQLISLISLIGLVRFAARRRESLLAGVPREVHTPALRIPLRPRLFIRHWWPAKEPAAELNDPIPAHRGASIVLGILATVYITSFAYWTVRNHDGLGTFGFDLGIFDQGVWLLSRFKEPFITVRGLHLFGDHLSFILVPLAPLYWIWPSPKVLLIAQSLAIGATTVPLYFIGRQKLRSGWLALGVVAAFMIQPAVSWANYEQFHPDVFEIPLIVLAFLLIINKRWRWLMVTVIALLLIKEDVPLLTFGLGIYVAIKHHRKVGLLVAGLSLVWLAANLLIFLPAFNESGTVYGGRIPFGGISGFVQTTLTDPAEVARHALKDDKPLYIWQLLAPLGLLPLIAPAVALVAAIPLGSNILLEWFYAYHIEYHYSTLIVPVLGVATVFGIARMRSRIDRQLAVGLMMVSALAGAYLWGPTPFARDPYPIGDPGTSRVRSVNEAIDSIPAEASVSAFYSYIPHLAHRTQVYEFANPWRASNWGDASREGEQLPEADDVDYLLLPKNRSDLGPEVNEVLDRISPEFTIVFQDMHVRLFKRHAD